jgi:hypothetical protein
MLGKQLTQAAAGAAAGEGLYVDDVFSTYVYEGTGSAQTITHGIDITGEGGMTWIKRRSGTSDHNLFDTERGFSSTASNILFPNSNSGQLSISSYVNATTNGFVLNHSGNDTNDSSSNYVSWNFRKAPGFFDVVTWTGNGVDERLISHNLGSTPGMIMVKCTSDSENWIVWHRNIATTSYLQLNTNDSLLSGINPWGSNTQTINSTHFSVNNYGSVNSSGRTYVAYVFAHDEQSFGTASDESIIKCGTFTTDSTGKATVDLGWDAQFALIKRTDSSQSWYLVDTMRGWIAPHGNTFSNFLRADGNNAETVSGLITSPTSTGFYADISSSATYIYIAIRRPHKPPTAGTEVFDVQTSTDDGSSGTLTSTSVTADLTITGVRSSGWDTWVVTRLIGNGGLLRTNQNSAETSYTQWSLDEQYGFRHTGFFASNSIVDYTFRRAPGFFDIVAYDGTGSARTIAHNLGAVPKMMIVKKRDSAESWSVYHEALGNNKNIWLNDSNAGVTNARWNNTTPTDSVFSVGTDTGTNGSGGEYIAYLFGDVSGVSKVGSYTGTATNGLQVDCGFTNGARFVMVKRTDGTGNWYVWDTARGINAGNDPYVALDNTNGEYNNNDFIDAFNAGFIINGSTSAGLNASGGTYLFLAIA